MQSTPRHLPVALGHFFGHHSGRQAPVLLGIVRQPDSDAGLRGSDIAGPFTVRLLVIGARCRGGGIREVVM